ncbi:MAG: hypothetical protein KGJ60_08440 [Verrucomicrobiota bacterium]|nr:hypothetical protein [Verrucomicrobiota bacterium]
MSAASYARNVPPLPLSTVQRIPLVVPLAERDNPPGRSAWVTGAIASGVV